MLNFVMELVVIGSGCGVPSQKRGAPGMLLRIGREQWLIDCGISVPTGLLSAGSSVTQADRILFTHFHPDHTAGLVPFIFACKYPGAPRVKDLNIIGPLGLRSFYERLRGAYGDWLTPTAFELHFTEMGQGDELGLLIAPPKRTVEASPDICVDAHPRKYLPGAPSHPLYESKPPPSNGNTQSPHRFLENRESPPTMSGRPNPSTCSSRDLDARAFDHSGLHATAEHRSTLIKVKTYRMKHTEISIGYRVESPDGKVLAISGDTDVCDELVEMGREADLLVLECSFPDECPVVGHLTPKSVGKIASAASPKRLLLTHFYPVCDSHDIAGQVARSYRGDFIIGEDGMRVEI